MRLAGFLIWEQRQELRHEFDGVRPSIRHGGTVAHGAIQCSLVAALACRLRGKHCQAYGSQLKLMVGGHIRYPDAFVACARIPPSATVVTDPVVVFEVLSDDSAHGDLIVKNAEYRATPSVRRYVVLQQSHAGALVFSRKSDDCVIETIGGQGTLLMPEIGIEIPLAEVYSDIELASGPETDLALTP